MTCAVKGCSRPHGSTRVFCTICVFGAQALAGKALSDCGVCASGPPEPGRVFCTACAIALTPQAVALDPDVCLWCLVTGTPHRYVFGSGSLSLPMCSACYGRSGIARTALAVNGVLHAASVAAVPNVPPAQAPAPQPTPPPAPTRPRGKPPRRARAPVTRYQIRLMPSGAWVGWLEHGLQPVTSAQALRFDDAADAAAWAAEKLRGRPCVVEPVEVTL